MSLKLKDKKKIALVFSGGGIKAAAFHIGVCLALREKGFKFAGGSKDYVKRSFSEDDPKVVRLYVGSSAGAFISAILSAGYSLESLVNAFNIGVSKKAFYEDDFKDSLRPITYSDIFDVNAKSIIKSLPKMLLDKNIFTGGLETFLKSKFKINGLFTTKGLEKYLREYALVYNDFNKLGVELFIVGTQLNHTRKVIFGNFSETSKNDRLMFANFASISQAVAASTSLPPVFSPYGIHQNQDKELFFFDGEIRDTLSTHVAADHGADLIISSYSVHPYHFNKEVGSLHQFGIPVILNQALYQVIQQKIDRHITHQTEISSVYAAIDSYFQKNSLPDEHKEKVLEIIRERLNFKPNADYIYVHPRPKDYEMFWADHFSLNSSVLERIVKIGFKSTISTLRKWDI